MPYASEWCKVMHLLLKNTCKADNLLEHKVYWDRCFHQIGGESFGNFRKNQPE